MKNKNFKKDVKTFVALLCLICLYCISGCRNRHHGKEIQIAHDLPQIKDSGELVVLTLYSSTSYFIYRGQEMGFQYELSEQFAKSLGLNLKIKVANSIRDLIEKLVTGEGDIIAYNLPITKEWKDSLLFCGEDVITHQVIIQQANGKYPLLKDVTDLVGKDIYVKPGRFYDRLTNLNKELGGGIHIHNVSSDSITSEELIAQVAQGEIPYTVADNDIAKLNKTYYPNLNINLSISFDQRSSWAVRRDCPKLATAANQWHKEHMTSPAYTASMKRYFENSKTAPHSPILSLEEGKISHFDDLFRKYSEEIDWDWRMLASLAYTESNFDTTVVSWAGAKGLMQLMPATARAMGIPQGKEQNAEESIKAAVKYIASTNHSLRAIKDKEERINFILASYNAGLGHIYDAMALADKYGKNKYIWKDNVENYILLKSSEEYFNDPVCKNGYFRGIETYNFVRDITARYEVYKQKIRY
ncbi:transglycosylase SLT domain protein [Bacteroides pyogenes F0041]|uniref:Transglycosylase SLT domain protein n=1 Tax=Bacteroides pyogenes F0041 TaxID=1321819 RepID=U2E016_9BACE|nr:transporter substrate-binding domain-containing protein [Bacteroides pyogenes]ERI85556.1 transglycosylase SLT domain protein [Bacteroides pyogenes F0041]MBB3893935.1 membrane-bound lytic murein transglycosylase F [Bacteroides pyogenes]GAE23404.1 transglycosylase [Bacteroides pyogenes JCM 10003]SUV34065.1 Predicted soluble lytic transglycosylase fused to an ABC-type amino acid-binding protein [Bacteroides pyogenes]